MESNGTNLLQGIDTIIVRVADIEIAKEWYAEKLGLALLFEDVNLKLVVLDTKGPTSLTLWQTDQLITVNPDTASYPIFRTPDAPALRQELLTRGVEVGEIREDAHVTYFFFYDPSGNVLEACQVYE